MIKFLSNTVAIALTAWTIIFVFTFFGGLGIEDCSRRLAQPIKNGDLLFPGIRLGCKAQPKLIIKAGKIAAKWMNEPL